MSISTKLLTVLFSAILMVSFAACEKGTVEHAGEKIDQAVEKTKEVTEEAGEKVKETVEEAPEKVKETTE